MATQFVNKHITRVLAAGGTVADTAWLSSVDTWITSQSLLPYLIDWANPAFGVIKNGSNEISKIMGLGATWLPRIGDLTPPIPANTTYAATGMSGQPAWVNSTSASTAYYGSARGGTIRLDNIRRKHRQGLTFVAVYQKNHAFVTTFIGMGDGGGNGTFLQNTAGSPGSCKFNVGPNSSTVFSDTHPTTLANNAVHIVGGTFDGNTITSFVEGIAGSGSSGYATTNNDGNYKQLRPLLGSAKGRGGQINYSLGSGSQQFGNSTLDTSCTRTIISPSGQAQMTISDLISFDTCLTPTQMASLNTLLRTRY